MIIGYFKVIIKIEHTTTNIDVDPFKSHVIIKIILPDIIHWMEKNKNPMYSSHWIKQEFGQPNTQYADGQ